MLDADEILRPKDTEKIVGLCDRQVRNLENAGDFPKRFSLSPGGRAKGYLKSAASRET